MKKSLAILLAFMLTFSALVSVTPVAFADSDITITNVSHDISAGTASYNVTLTASSDGATPAVAIVHYEDGVLTNYAIEKCALSSGVPAPVTASIPILVTDESRIVGFVLKSLTSPVPLRIDEIKKFGSPINTVTKVEAEGLSSADIVVDSSAKTISFYIPYYDRSGNAVDYSATDVTFTLGHPAATAKLSGTDLTVNDSKAVVTMDITAPGQVLEVTSQQGTTAAYSIDVYRTISEDFNETESERILVSTGKTSAKGAATLLYSGKGDTASKMMQVASFDIGVAGEESNLKAGYDAGAFFIENAYSTSGTQYGSMRFTCNLDELSGNTYSDYQSIEFRYKQSAPSSAYTGSGYNSYHKVYEQEKQNGRLGNADSTYRITPNYNGSQILIRNNESQSSGKSVNTDVAQGIRVRVDFMKQANGKWKTKFYFGESLTENPDMETHVGEVAEPLTHWFWTYNKGNNVKITIDDFKLTRSICSSNPYTPSAPSAPGTGASTLSYTPSIDNGVITISGMGKYGNVSAMVAKASSDGSAADFEALSNGALVFLDAKSTNNDGSFDFINEPAGLAAGWYTFAVGNKGIEAPVVHTIYYASPEEMTDALNAINSADAATLPSKLVQYENALQIAALLDDSIYVAHSAAVAKDLVAQRQNGAFTKETLASALSLAIGAQAVANANSSTIDAALSTYGSALGLDAAGFDGVKAAALRCYAGVKGEYYATATPSAANIDTFFDKVIALAKVNTAARDKVVGIITDNYFSLGIDTSALTTTDDKNTVAKAIAVTDQSKEYMTISALSGAYDRAVGSLGSGGSRPSSPSTPIVSTGNTTSEIQISGEVTTEVPVFNDIHLALWAEEYIICLAENGIVSGKGNGKFDPMGYVTREEFAKMLTMAVNSDGTADIGFTDVDPNAWYAPYIANAVATGLAAGYEDGTFGIGKSISRQEAAVMIARAASLIHSELPRGRHDFVDSGSIASWADEAVGQCVALGIISGNNAGEFLPANSITRAECAKMIYCLIRTE